MILKWHSPFRLLAALARSVYAKLFGYQVLAPVDVWDARLDKCMNCEELIDQQCRICTCNVEAKAALALEQCPKKLWLRVWKKRTIKT